MRTWLGSQGTYSFRFYEQTGLVHLMRRHYDGVETNYDDIIIGLNSSQLRRLSHDIGEVIAKIEEAEKQVLDKRRQDLLSKQLRIEQELASIKIELDSLTISTSTRGE